MNATKSTNPTKDFPHKRSESNSHHSSFAASRIPTITGSNRSSSSNLLLEASSPTSSQSPIVATTTTQEYSRVPQSAMATMAFAGEEMGAVVYKDTTKLISTAIKFININNNSNNNDNSGQHRTNSQTSEGNSNSNKSTSKSTATSDVDKSASSKFINSRNKLTTITHVRQQQQEQTQQQRRQQAEQILSTTRDLNQINLKSSLYADQQACNDNHNSNNKNMDNNQRNDIHNKLNANVCRSNNNNPNSLNNDNNKKQLREMCETPNNSNESCSDEAYDNEHNNSRKSHKNNNTCSNGNVNESNELEQQQQLQQPPSHQQQLITATKASKQTIKIVTASEIKTATKVRAEKIATTAKAAVMDTTIKPTASAAPAKERAKAATLTLRKSLSTPASFKIDDVACSHKSNNSNNNYNYSHVDSNGHSNNVKLLISGNAQEKVAEVEKMEALRGAKDNGNGGGGGGGCGGDVGNAGNHDKCTKTAAKFTNTSLEATTATTQITTITAASTSTKAATMDVVMRPQYAVHGAQLEQQQQQPDTKLAKAKVNDNQVICGSCNVTGSKDVSSTTNASSSLPLPAVSFDLDLRFGCAHYKRRAMFVTPCCNKFYKCRFCHDENESHHFDRKTLTELICSECNTRQKVQEQCEACGTRFGKYTCLICNLFDDTDKKQYHCNGCGICRIGGAENFFHCEVCDMCLPIRLKIDGHRCVENISRSHCPVCLGDIHTSRIPCHIPDCGHLLHKTCFDQLLNSGHYTCPICQTSLIDMTALWEYLDAQAVSLPVPKKYENQRIHIFCNDCHKTSKTKFNFIGLKCMQCGAYNTTQDVKRRMSLVTDEPSSA